MKNLILALLAKIEGISESVWNFLEPILASNAGKLLGQLLPLAESVVASLADGTQDGAAKRAAAFTQITQAAESAGIAATTSIINTAIELAVQKLAASAPAPTSN